MASKVDELLVEEPGKLKVQCGIMGYLAGKYNTLTHSHVQMTCWTGDHSWLCKQRAPYQQWGFPLSEQLYFFQTAQPVCCMYFNTLISASLSLFLYVPWTLRNNCKNMPDSKTNPVLCQTLSQMLTKQNKLLLSLPVSLYCIAFFEFHKSKYGLYISLNDKRKKKQTKAFKLSHYSRSELSV